MFEDDAHNRLWARNYKRNRSCLETAFQGQAVCAEGLNHLRKNTNNFEACNTLRRKFMLTERIPTDCRNVWKLEAASGVNTHAFDDRCLYSTVAVFVQARQCELKLRLVFLSTFGIVRVQSFCSRRGFLSSELGRTVSEFFWAWQRRLRPRHGAQSKSRLPAG